MASHICVRVRFKLTTGGVSYKIEYMQLRAPVFPLPTKGKTLYVDWEACKMAIQKQCPCCA